ncbi:PREDICTED: NAC domain-containing protein 86-like isoform X3 [Populus euphratica]|uniref:NAC domain-containing protein 86-like isoform X3 n=1 Tax=Populus euphratica TaxID=75702 RepID=A0AAJ6V0Q7_POPEU|nr:PREDICTED: NAC domain-containing protein 86-like isoform X3 [Populus euphratica]
MSYNFPSAMNSSTNPNPSIPEVGYRFHPTNEELVCNYLKPKILGDDVEDLSIMPVVHVCKHEPSELPDKSNIKSKDAVWYFFCPRDFKYLNSGRYNRRTKLGFWKPTGKILKIRFTGTKKVIGTRKTLVFYTKACPKPIRTGWIMHEYEYSSDLSPCNQGGYVLCKLKKKPEVRTNKSEPNHHMVSISDFEAAPSFPNQREFVLCKLKKDPDAMMPTYKEGEASFNVTSDHSENQNLNEYYHPQTFEDVEYGAWTAFNFTNNELEEDTYQLQAELDSFRGYYEGCHSLNALFP